ncbi:MAG: LemA family protein [Planctomycetota bacterium]
MKRLGKKCIAVFVLLVVVSVVLVLLYKSGSEKAVHLQEEAAQAWSNVEKHLEQRAELVPNLLGAVRGYVEFENELFENIAKSRQKYLAAVSRAEKIEASNEFGGFLSQLPDLKTKYRELRTNEDFVSLLAELEEAKNSIATARKAYNDSANRLNTYASRFFGKHFCKKAGVERAELFQSAE